MKAKRCDFLISWCILSRNFWPFLFRFRSTLSGPRLFLKLPINNAHIYLCPKAFEASCGCSIHTSVCVYCIYVYLHQHSHACILVTCRGYSEMIWHISLRWHATLQGQCRHLMSPVAGTRPVVLAQQFNCGCFFTFWPWHYGFDSPRGRPTDTYTYLYTNSHGLNHGHGVSNNEESLVQDCCISFY
jgi:hypothetical protein